MNSHRDPLHCIIPPHILRALATHEDPAVREIALRSIVTASIVRGRRQILSQMTPTMHSAGKHRSISTAGNTQQTPGKLVRGEGDPPAKDQAVNDAYDALGATYDLYFDIFQRDSIDGRGMRLVASVHYGKKFDNAFWDGQQMVFGDGDGKLFLGFTKAIDVVGHELTHGVTQYTANLEYHNQPGALNESFSDVFGSLVKQYHAKEDAHTADWLIGEGILGPSIKGQALRSMAEPGTAYDDPTLGGKDPQPDHMDHYVDLPDDYFDDNGGVHINSGIPNKAFYLVATKIGGNAWEDAGHIWYETLTHRLGPSSQFQDCADATYQVAGELFGSGGTQQQAVEEAWDEVGIAVTTVTALRGRKARRPLQAVEGNGAALKKQLEKVTQELNRLVVALGSMS